MDIRQWLENTADREPPDRSDDIAIPDKFRNDRREDDQAGRSYRYKRRRTSNDSSMIAAPKERHRQASKLQARPPSSGQARQAQQTAGDLERRYGSDSSRSGSDDAPQKTYERRARHKTRADRYEPKAKKRVKDRTARKDDKGNRKRRKPRRNDDGGRTTGLVQSFQLRNGPKNNRLTLKPDTSAGLFKHGRASGQVTGNGAGLPDLVFNEMRFLQKPSEHQDEVSQGLGHHKSRGTDKPNQPEEISAYFNAKTATNKEHDGQLDFRQRQAEIQFPRHESRVEADNPESLVELPKKPFLGFGSRGVEPMDDTGPNDDGSYFSWSESLRQAARPHPDQACDASTGHAVHTKPKLRQDSTGRAHNCSDAFSVELNLKRKLETLDQNVLPGRGGVAARVEVFKPPKPTSRHERYFTPALQTTSQSLPRYPSSPPRISKYRDSGAIPRSEEDRDYHTSDILRIEALPAKLTGVHPLTDQHDKENQDPASSLSIDKAIRQAKIAAVMPQSIPQYPSQAPDIRHRYMPDTHSMRTIKDLPSIRKLSRPNQPRSHEAFPNEQKHSVPTHIQRDKTASHLSLLAAERQRWERAAVDTLALGGPQMIYHQRPIYFREDDPVFEGLTSVNAPRTDIKDDLDNAWHENSSTHGHRFTPRSSMYEAQILSASYRPTTSAFSRLNTSRSGVVGGPNVAQEGNSYGLSGEQVNQVDDEMTGFWKPNVLY